MELRSRVLNSWLTCTLSGWMCGPVEELWFQTGSVNSMKTSAIRSCAWHYPCNWSSGVANNACRIILISASSCVLNNSETSSIGPELMVITVSGFWKHPIIHSMNVKRFKSFGDLAKDYFKVLLSCFHSFGCACRIILVSASSCVLNNTGTSSIEPELMQNLSSLTWRVMWLNVDNMNLKFAWTFFSNT
jgi:hypothetical protein